VTPDSRTATYSTSAEQLVADRVIFTASGMIVEEEALEEFFSNPRRKRRKKLLTRFSLTETQYRL